ncbi:MAG: succinylglutamate desuccinylase/aspartoacylase family protein [Rickettsiaceae bacterium]|nr:succinylglutamate desuccinylase/aspartoacylase family protein [Rickettsiaceae bacterium]
MKNKKLQICNTLIHPGEEANLALPLPDNYSCAPLYMPIKVIHGLKKGPCLLLFSTLNGNELNGIEIVNRIMENTKPDQISGTIIAIPVMNVYGLTHFPSPSPSNERLIDCFPGKVDGTYGERFAHIFIEEILKKADYCIELDTGDLNHNILPQIYCNENLKESKQLAKAFNPPVITNISFDDNSLRQTTEDLHIPLLVYQAGEAMRFDENAIKVGCTGITNIMHALNIMSSDLPEQTKPLFSQKENWISAHTAGILHTNYSLGQVIKKGEILGKITDPFGTGSKEKVKAPKDGIIVGINTTPLAHEGMPLFKVASFVDYDRAETAIEAWDKRQDTSFLD